MRSDADDGVDRAREGQRFAQYGGIARKAAGPPLITDYCQRVAAKRLVVRVREEPPELRLHAEHVEVLAGDKLGLHPLEVSAAAHRSVQVVVETRKRGHS